MSDTPTPTTDKTCARKARGGKRRGFVTGLFAGGLVVTGVLGATAIASGPGGFAAHGPCGGDMTVEAVEARMSRAADFMLDEVDATDAQRAQVDALIVATAPEVVTHRLEGQALREALLDELAQDQVDEAAVQRLRNQGLALIDDGSAEHLDTLLSLADILEADQRQELIALADDWHR